MNHSTLSSKFWEAESKLKDGYLVKKEENKQEKKEEPILVPEIRNGKIIGWRPF